MVIGEGMNFPRVAFQTCVRRGKMSCSFLKKKKNKKNKKPTKTSYKSTIDDGKTICLSLAKNKRLDENRQN